MSGGSLDTNRIDDEHRLIARYAARLAADANHAVSIPSVKGLFTFQHSMCDSHSSVYGYSNCFLKMLKTIMPPVLE